MIESCNCFDIDSLESLDDNIFFSSDWRSQRQPPPAVPIIRDDRGTFAPAKSVTPESDCDGRDQSQLTFGHLPAKLQSYADSGEEKDKVLSMLDEKISALNDALNKIVILFSDVHFLSAYLPICPFLLDLSLLLTKYQIKYHSLSVSLKTETNLFLLSLR